MTASQLVYGRRVVWRNLPAEIVNIRWAPRTVLVQIRLAGNHTHWTTPEALTVEARGWGLEAGGSEVAS